MLKLLPYPLLFLALFTSCKKEADEVQPVAQTRFINPATTYLGSVQSSSLAAEYISANVDYYPLYFADYVVPAQSDYYHCSVDTGLFGRQTPSGDMKITFSMCNMKLFQQQKLPITWPQTPSAGGVIITIARMGAGKAQSYNGSTASRVPMKFTVTSIANDVVEGEFQGTFWECVNGVYTGLAIDVTQGKFKIKAQVFR